MKKQIDKTIVEPVPAKRVITYDSTGKENGFLIELSKQGNITTSYLSCTFPGAFKGFHCHRLRIANYVCVKGSIKIILYMPYGRIEYTLTADSHQRLTIPTGIPTGLLNDGSEEAWIINTPVPGYDPELKNEQVEFTQEQLSALYNEPFIPGRPPLETIPYSSK